MQACTWVTHMRTQNADTVHILLIHSFNHKQVCYTHYAQTDAPIRLPTIFPPIRHQTAVWRLPSRSFWSDSMGVIGAHVSPISLHQQTAICPHRWLSVLSGGHQLGWLGHSQNSIFSSLLECVCFCCLLKCWLWLRTFPLLFVFNCIFINSFHYISSYFMMASGIEHRTSTLKGPYYAHFWGSYFFLGYC